MGRTLQAALLIGASCFTGMAIAQERTGAAAFGDYTTDAPGVVRKITAADVPPPSPSTSRASPPGQAARPPGAMPRTLPGFAITEFAHLDHPRLIRVAPNGDVFVSETQDGRIEVLRAQPGAGAAAVVGTFAEGLHGPFGLAFYPNTSAPHWLYVAENNSVVRYPYRTGDLKARGPSETIVAELAKTHGGHSTRDIVFSRDGSRMFVSDGSGSNIGEEAPKKTPDEARLWQATHALGADWGPEEDRADVLAFDPLGKDRSVYATGIRNCVGLTRSPGSDQLWCSTNERDLLGDDLVPDYITRVNAGAFYGWPWYYIGDHEDPRLAGLRPDLKGKVTVPDILLQAHSASLQMSFYPPGATGPSAFPAAYRGQIFAAEHGSWNRAKRTGYKIIMAKVVNGVPTGEYEDFVTGFVVDDASVWGRPVGVDTAKDGALLFSDDVSGTVWRVAPKMGMTKVGMK
jgi:glucose/arabinose dehydrogenase